MAEQFERLIITILFDIVTKNSDGVDSRDEAGEDEALGGTEINNIREDSSSAQPVQTEPNCECSEDSSNHSEGQDGAKQISDCIDSFYLSLPQIAEEVSVIESEGSIQYYRRQQNVEEELSSEGGEIISFWISKPTHSGQENTKQDEETRLWEVVRQDRNVVITHLQYHRDNRMIL